MKFIKNSVVFLAFLCMYQQPISSAVEQNKPTKTAASTATQSIPQQLSSALTAVDKMLESKDLNDETKKYLSVAKKTIMLAQKRLSCS